MTFTTLLDYDVCWATDDSTFEFIEKPARQFVEILDLASVMFLS